MSSTIHVPADAESICEACRLARTRGDEFVIIEVDAEYEEPREAWPLELEVDDASSDCKLKRLDIVGLGERTAVVRDVSLRAAGPVGFGPSIALRGLCVRGQALVSGQGCHIVDCVVQRGIEIDTAGAGTIRSCAVTSGRIGIAAHGPAVVENNAITSCDIAVCLYGNPKVTLRGNQLQQSCAAAMVVHCSLAAEEGSQCQLASVFDSTNTIEDCERSVEIQVEIDGASPLVLDEFPLANCTHSVPTRRGGVVVIQVDDQNVLRVLHVDRGPDAKKQQRKKRKRNEPSAPTVGPAWALEVLGIADAAGELTIKYLKRAYRRKALEVHPDKRPQPKAEAVDNVEAGQRKGESSVGEVGALTPFHKVAAAYEAVLANLASRPEDAPAPTTSKANEPTRPTAKRRRRAQSSTCGG